MAEISFKGGNRKNPWNVSIRRKGFPLIYKSFKTEAEAIEFAKRTEEGLDSIGDAQGVPKLPLKIWIDRWRKEIGPNRTYLNKEKIYLSFWEKCLGNEIAIDISPVKIEFIADQICNEMGRLGTKKSPETRRKYLLYLSSLYTTAIKTWRWAFVNPLSCVNMIKKDYQKKVNIKENIETFNQFRIQFSDLVKDKMIKERLSQRDGAEKCSMTLHSFQCVINTKANPTLLSISKVCQGFGIKIQLEEVDENKK